MMKLDHVTLQDDTLTHQVRFVTRGNTVCVSCNCRLTTGDHSKAGKAFHEPITSVRDLDEARRLFNDPENHWAKFGDEDHAKW